MKTIQVSQPSPIVNIFQSEQMLVEQEKVMYRFHKTFQYFQNIRKNVEIELDDAPTVELKEILRLLNNFQVGNKFYKEARKLSELIEEEFAIRKMA